jgi:hypothetical protein
MILLVAPMVCGAQSVKTDNNGMYAEINPVEVGWISKDYTIQRVYVNPTKFAIDISGGTGTVSYYWWLMYPIQIDSNTVNWTKVGGPLGEGYRTSKISHVDATLQQATITLFQEVRDSAGLDIGYK